MISDCYDTSKTSCAQNASVIKINSLILSTSLMEVFVGNLKVALWRVTQKESSNTHCFINDMNMKQSTRKLMCSVTVLRRTHLCSLQCDYHCDDMRLILLTNNIY